MGTCQNSGLALLISLMAGCWATPVPGLAPYRVLLMVGHESYMYEGAAVRLSNLSDDPRLTLTVRVLNLGTLGASERQVSVDRAQPLSLNLDGALVPDLASGEVIVPIELSAAIDGAAATPGTSQQARFKVVRDKEARLPTASGIGTASIYAPDPDQVGPWVQIDDTAPMEDAALAFAYAWGGRDLAVSKAKATADELATIPGADKYLPPIDIYRFEVTGAFPKWVVPAVLTGAGADAVGVPKAIRALLPRVRRPIALKTEIVL